MTVVKRDRQNVCEYWIGNYDRAHRVSAVYPFLCNSQSMSPDAVKSMLLPHEVELKNGGIQRLAIFGSVARDEAGER
jgi:hypothetical protein